MNAESTDGSASQGPLKKLKGVIAGDGFAAEVERLLGTVADLNGRLAWLEARVVEVEAERDRWSRLAGEMPGLLHSVSVITGGLRRMSRDITDLERQWDDQTGQAERLAASVHELWEHVRVVRAEIMHEIRDGALPGGSSVGIEPEVVEAETLERLAAAGPLKLNLGCGHILLDGYANVDMRPLPGVEVVAALDRLPFEPGTVGEIFSAHVLEHFPVETLRRRLLPYWHDLLVPGGEFRAVVPDAVAMAHALVEGRSTFEEYAEVLMGGQEYEGDHHFTAFSAERMAALLTETGFVDFEVVAEGRPLDICLELEVRARRDG